MFSSVQKLMEIEPEKVAMFQMRGHAPWYIKGLKSSTKVKMNYRKLIHMSSWRRFLAEYKLYLDEISWYLHVENILV